MEHDLAFRTLARIQVVHAIESAQQGGLAAARRSNESSYLVVGNVHVDIFNAFEIAVIEIQIADLQGSVFASGHGLIGHSGHGLIE